VDARGALHERGIDIEYRLELLVFHDDLSRRFLSGSIHFPQLRPRRARPRNELANRNQGMIFYAMSVIGMETFQHVPGEHVDHARSLLAAEMSMDRIRARANGLRRSFTQAMCSTTMSLV